MPLSRVAAVLAIGLLAAVGSMPGGPARVATAAEGDPTVCHWIGTVTRPAERLGDSQHLITLQVEREMEGPGDAAGGERTIVLNSIYGATYYRGVDIRTGLSLETRGYQRGGGQCVVDTLAVGTLGPGLEGFLRPAGACPTAVAETISVVDQASRPLGCAAAPALVIPTSLQRFQGGLMLYLGGIYVLAYGPPALGEGRLGGGDWSGVRNTYREPEPASAGLTPPGAELVEPVLGFGKSWREHYGGPNGPLGWGVEAEHTEEAAWQLFDQGIVAVTSRGEGFILYHDRRAWEQRNR
jgi:hypothetical protein